ncbi:hypothetical protein R2R29_22530 [Vibrio diabolicus]|uniref:hypothetical protein n=1 Tax=Vibrio diabolicus TaxID=50719 RepID=UPI00293F891B|nr:hypothetical protein [Vibrio diabolicus]MDV5087205.1 hypothetical protein [Vibrio diabolicus]
MELHEVYDSLEKELYDQSEVELVLLKGHLILEQAINQHLLLYIESKKSLDALNLMFAKKVDLLVALEGSQPSAWQEYVPYIKRINSIRNKLAHQLNFDDYHDDLKAWACDVVGYTPKTLNRQTTYRNTVAKAFCFLVGFLVGVCAIRQEVASIKI